MKRPFLVFLLGLVPPVGAVAPSLLKLEHPSARIIFLFGLFLAVVWFIAATILRSDGARSHRLAKGVLILYLLTGIIGLVRFESTRYSQGFAVLAAWIMIWLIVPVVVWLLVGKPASSGSAKPVN